MLSYWLFWESADSIVWQRKRDDLAKRANVCNSLQFNRCQYHDVNA